MKKVLLLIVAIVLATILFPLGFLFTIGRAAWQGSLSKMVGYLLATSYALAIAIDHFGNVFCRDMFNSLVIGRGGYAFGNIRETISSAMGKNQQRGTLTWAGVGLAWILDTIDKDHCLKSIKDV